MKVLEIWSEFNKTAKLVIIALLALFIGTFVFSFSKENAIKQWKKDYENYRDSVAVVLEWAKEQNILADSALAVADSIKVVADSQTVQLAQTQATVRQLNRRNQELIRDLVGDSTDIADVNLDSLPPVAQNWARLAISLKEENDSLYSVVNRFQVVLDERLIENQNLRVSLNYQTQRADSLQAQLEALPKGPPSETLFGFIPLPSRRASFVIGAILGAVAAYAIVSE